MLLKTLCIALLLAAFPQFSPADEPTCFLQDGDRVAFFGDSITAHKVYGDLVERIFRQAHPEAEVEFINNGNSGLQLAATKLDRVLKGDPNVITIMIGMNDAINSEWVAGDPLGPKVASYKSSLTALVRSLKEQGKVVVLLSPTLTEETVSLSTFRLEGTRELLSLMGQAVEEVAQEESVYFVPVQAEFEAYANTLPRYAVLRPDGVHPNARGQYQIARSLWTHLQLTAPMGKQRGMADNLPNPWIALAPTSSLSFSDSEALTLELTTPEPGMADLTWSCGEESGSTSIELTGSNIWTLPLSESEIPAVPGSSTTAIIELKRGSSRAVFLVDFFRKTIVHAENGVATIDVSSDEGDTIATSRISREGKGLRFETSVFKDELIQGERGQSPWGKGDAVTLFLDLREPSLLGGLGYDGDVY
ncbi:MAG: SGNH/GDSL hydrolase family protein, partial [Puniceicoccales bacterium]